MKKTLALILVVLLSVIYFFPKGTSFAAALPAQKEFYKEDVFGSYVETVLYGADVQTLDRAFDAVLSVFEEVENAVSAGKPESDIARFNALNADSEINYIENVSNHTITLLKEAKKIYAGTGGAFNPCAFILTDLWQLSPRFNDGFPTDFPYDRPQQKLPDQAYINAFKQLTDFSKVEIEGNRITKTAAPITVNGISYDLQIDLGAIAKGYACDKAQEILAAHGVTSGRLSAGGSSTLLLANPQKDNWTVGLIAPDYSGAYAEIEINGSLSTSGDYQNYFILNGGVRYCHIMDTKTGAPIRTNIRTASVYGENLSGMEADALSTAVMAMDFETAKSFVNSPSVSNRGIKIIFVHEKSWAMGTVFEIITNTTKDSLGLRNLDYRLCGFVSDAGSFVYRPLLPDLWFWLTITALAGAVLFFVIRRTRSNAQTHKQAAAQQIYSLKQQKFFLKTDLFVYAFLAVLIIVLLIIFVFAPSSEAIALLEVRHKNVLIYRYDFDSGQGEIMAADFVDNVAVTILNGKTEIKIEIDGHYNIITVENRTAKVTQSNCSLRKDCVNAFPALTRAGQAVICRPHHLKIIAAGAGGNDTLLNG